MAASRQLRSAAKWGLPLAVLVTLGGVLLWSATRPEPAPAVDGALTPSPEAGDGHPGGGKGPSGAPARMGAPGVAMPGMPPVQDGTLTERELWTRRLERAQRTLDSYRASTRYPPTSRPASEHPDQMDPRAPIARKRPMQVEDHKGSDTQLLLRQDRVFAVGMDTVHLSVACETSSGAQLPCTVTSAVATAVTESPEAAGLPPSPVAFNEDGRPASDVAASFQPARHGFERYHGLIRVEIRVRAGSEEGGAFFDILYTPAPPAAFTGKIREAVEAGSLSLYVGLSVQRPGRYVITARADDADGKPFALLTFNDELTEKSQEAKLLVFGKLLLDQKPRQPLRIRDIDGFLLREDADPDRELVQPLPGLVHTTRTYPESTFSSAEWESEERTRYLEELSRDVNAAQQQLDTAPPGR